MVDDGGGLGEESPMKKRTGRAVRRLVVPGLTQAQLGQGARKVCGVGRSSESTKQRRKFSARDRLNFTSLIGRIHLNTVFVRDHGMWLDFERDTMPRMNMRRPMFVE
jgi:hypothetical protein